MPQEYGLGTVNLHVAPEKSMKCPKKLVNHIFCATWRICEHDCQPGDSEFSVTIWLWRSQFAMENPPIFKFGKPSISMGHLYHGYVK